MEVSVVAEDSTCFEQSRKGQLPKGGPLKSGKLLLGQIEEALKDCTKKYQASLVLWPN